ncbi:MAG: hypothetical protein JWO98_5302 [Frankiales bacterium]|nr:hypothetical protein [Frankiales bacterium]
MASTASAARKNLIPFSTAAAYLNGVVARYDEYAIPVSGDDLARWGMKK